MVPRGATGVLRAVVDPADSLSRFIRLFVHPPHDDADAARQWLTSLVLRQSTHFFAQPRELGFFRAFETYTRGDNPASALYSFIVDLR